jgi:hypothetical protein
MAVPLAAGAQDGPVFHDKTPFAEVWVSTDLAEHRADEDYIPVMVAIKNQGPGAATLTRDSFHLEGPDGKELPMPSVETLREDYPKTDFDYTMGRVYGFTGIPVGTRLLEHMSVPSSFFPAVRSGQVVWDSVQLPKNYWTVDLLYFPTPVGFADGREATLVVESDAWEEPVEVDFNL